MKVGLVAYFREITTIATNERTNTRDHSNHKMTKCRCCCCCCYCYVAAKATYIRLPFWQKGGFSALAP